MRQKRAPTNMLTTDTHDTAHPQQQHGKKQLAGWNGHKSERNLLKAMTAV